MEPTKNEIQLLLSYLDQVLETTSSKLVGKTLKRIELIEPDNIPENKFELMRLSNLKKQLKELIYESMRDMRDIFYAYQYGLESGGISFTVKENNKE